MNVKAILEELPERFHEEFMECIVDKESIKNLRKVYDYFLEEIIDKLTDEEKEMIFGGKI